MSESDAAPVGLRERKKQMTRQALYDAAERLFEERGYDNVTVAEIADAANISVKTMFTYVESKEDLAFAGEADVRDALVDAVRDRPEGTSAVEAVAGLLRGWIASMPNDASSLSGLEGYHRGYGESAALQSRLLRMWADFEDAITATLTGDAKHDYVGP